MKFTVEARLNIPPEKVYSYWLDTEGHTNMTGGEAKISDKVNEEFSAWDGYISGKNLELRPFEYIKQTWRTTEFAEDNPDSILEIILEKDNQGTLIKLVHSNLPKHGNQYIQGWEDFYFNPMRAYFQKS